MKTNKQDQVECVACTVGAKHTEHNYSMPISGKDLLDKPQEPTREEEDWTKKIPEMYVDDMLTWGMEDKFTELSYEERLKNETYKRMVDMYTDGLVKFIKETISNHDSSLRQGIRRLPKFNYKEPTNGGRTYRETTYVELDDVKRLLGPRKAEETRIERKEA